MYKFRILVSACIIFCSSKALPQILVTPATEVAVQDLYSFDADTFLDPTQPYEEEGLFLLAEHDLFYAKFDTGLQYTSNAFLTDNRRSDSLLDTNIAIGADTRIANRIDIKAEFNTGITRYKKNSELDYDSLGADLEAAIQFKRTVRIGLRYQPELIYERRFNDRQLTLHNISVFADIIYSFRSNSALVAEVKGSRILTDRDDFDAIRASVTFGFVYLQSSKIKIFTGIVSEYQEYDDYFENLTDKKRYDYRVSPLVSVVYQVGNHIELSLDLSGTFNDSSLEPLDYDVFNASPVFEANYRF